MSWEEDNKYLDLLSMFHYILAGITALFSCLPIIHVVIGILMLSGKFVQDSGGAEPPRIVGMLFLVMGSLLIILGWGLAICLFIAGKKLKNRRNRIFCMVVAGIECVFMPLGTVLGIFTLIVLSKDSVKEIFDRPAEFRGHT
jgi:hypothetical protein